MMKNFFRDYLVAPSRADDPNLRKTLVLFSFVASALITLAQQASFYDLLTSSSVRNRKCIKSNIIECLEMVGLT